MRYCCHCGNPLSVGASFCHSCGAPLKALVPEADETPVAVSTPETVITPVVEPAFEPAPVSVFETPTQEAPTTAPVAEPVPVVIPAYKQDDVLEEKAFLEQTNRLLRWERKAWSIAGKVYLILGIVLAALYFVVGVIVGAAVEELTPVALVAFAYALVFGLTFIAIGIVNIKAAGKINQYTDTLFKDFRAAHKRCNSIGMIIFSYIFNTIALVFYLINFIRMKTNRDMADRILTRQGFK